MDGTFEQLDFLFCVGNEAFDKPCFLVDGICPELSHFVKTVSAPLMKAHCEFAMWQEVKRKSTERAFGVVQRKLQTLCRPMEQWCKDDIKFIVETCFILHNVVVEVRGWRERRGKRWSVASFFKQQMMLLTTRR